MSPRTLPLLLACVVVVTVACGSSRQADETPAPPKAEATLRVDNADFLDMTVYVLDGTQRVRVGIAKGKAVTTLAIPQHLVRGVRTLRFQADPIGGRRTPVSEEILVEPGDEVSLLIPAN